MVIMGSAPRYRYTPGDGPWLDRYCATKQIEVIESCFATTSDPTRWEAFTTALGYYIAASHDATAKIAVMLPVSGLTMLSSTLFQKDLASVRPPHLRAHARQRQDRTRVRRLMHVVGADTAFPAHLVHANSAYNQIIARTTASHQPVDALSAVASMRNEVAHPELNNTQARTTYQWRDWLRRAPNVRPCTSPLDRLPRPLHAPDRRVPCCRSVHPRAVGVDRPITRAIVTSSTTVVRRGPDP